MSERRALGLFARLLVYYAALAGVAAVRFEPDLQSE
jgi:hypothetical protein